MILVKNYRFLSLRKSVRFCIITVHQQKPTAIRRGLLLCAVKATRNPKLDRSSREPPNSTGAGVYKRVCFGGEALRLVRRTSYVLKQ